MSSALSAIVRRQPPSASRVLGASLRALAADLKPVKEQGNPRHVASVAVQAENASYLNSKAKYSVMTVASAIDARPHSARCGS